jgi:hypothetical protein
MGVLRKLDRNGDTETRWDPADDGQLGAARLVFYQHLKAGGLAFEVDAPREPAEVVRTFNPRAKEIILAPRMVGG